MTLQGETVAQLNAAIEGAVKAGLTFEAWWVTDYEWKIKYTGGY